LTKQLQQLSIQHTVASQTTALVAPPNKTSEVHTVQSTNPKATQQPEGKKKQRNKGKGDKKPTDNAGGVGSQPNFFRLLSKAAYTPCRITTNHCRIVLMDTHLIFAIITIQYQLKFSQLQV
jgi:hypothetical protein